MPEVGLSLFRLHCILHGGLCNCDLCGKTVWDQGTDVLKDLRQLLGLQLGLQDKHCPPGT